MKKVTAIYSAPRPHWVGDGFPVRTLCSYHQQGQEISPFLLLDYAGPAYFPPALHPRGVGQHPHQGFETVTLVYQGELQHRDSSGGGGVIGPGDVQWMTAGSGIVHDEFHSPAFTRSGGTLEMVQLWVNLPARHKHTAAGYQTIVAADIPQLPLSGGAGYLRLIAGQYAGHHGPARTFTPLDLWDLRLHQGASLSLEVHAGHNVALAVLHGQLRVGDGPTIAAGQLALLDRQGTELHLHCDLTAQVLLLSGAPIDEPIVGHGPFVMNTEAEIEQALRDFRNGQFGHLGNSSS